MPSLKQLHADFLEDLEIAQGRSPKTVENYDRYLQRFFTQQQISSLAAITPEAVRQFRRYLSVTAVRPQDISQAGLPAGQAGVSLATQNYHLIALRQFLKYVAKRDIAALAPDRIGLAKLGERDIDVLYPEEIDALLKSPPLHANTPGAARDRAMLETLFSTGIRVAELISLDRDDIRQQASEVAVRGKGNKIRVVFLSDSAQRAISEYVAQREDIDPALFIRHHAGPAGTERGADNLRLTPRSVQRLIKKYAAAAGLTKNITPHTLRHSYATDLLSNGADVRQVQQLLGHASITTTQHYTHLTDVHLKDIHERYHRKTSS